MPHYERRSVWQDGQSNKWKLQGYEGVGQLLSNPVDSWDWRNEFPMFESNEHPCSQLSGFSADFIYCPKE